MCKVHPLTGASCDDVTEFVLFNRVGSFLGGGGLDSLKPDKIVGGIFDISSLNLVHTREIILILIFSCFFDVFFFNILHRKPSLFNSPTLNTDFHTTKCELSHQLSSFDEVGAIQCGLQLNGSGAFNGHFSLHDLTHLHKWWPLSSGTAKKKKKIGEEQNATFQWLSSVKCVDQGVERIFLEKIEMNFQSLMFD